MRPPIEVDAVGEVSGSDKWRVKSWAFTVIDARAAGAPWTLAVPIIDVDLVLTAFAAVSLK